MRMRKPSVGILLLVVLLVGCGSATATAVSTSLATSFSTSTVTAGAATSTATTPALTPTPIPTLMGSVSTIPPSTPATSGAQVVTVQGSDRVNVRATASPTAAVIALFGAGADVLVVGQDTTGSDGARWVHVQAGDRDGYIRSDLVSGPHASAGVLPTPVFLATRTATLPAPMITPTPRMEGAATPSLVTVAVTMPVMQVQTAVPTRAPTPSPTLAPTPKPTVIAAAPARSTVAAIATTGPTPQSQDDRETQMIAQGMETWRKLSPGTKPAYAQALIHQYPDTPRHPSVEEIVRAIDQFATTHPAAKEEDFGLSDLYLALPAGATIQQYLSLPDDQQRLQFGYEISVFNALPCGSTKENMTALARQLLSMHPEYANKPFADFYEQERMYQVTNGGTGGMGCAGVNRLT